MARYHGDAVGAGDGQARGLLQRGHVDDVDNTNTVSSSRPSGATSKPSAPAPTGWIGLQAQAAIRASLDGRPNVELYTYPGRAHAFARPDGGHSDAADAKLANARTDAFLQRHLSI